jgi:hypothetical protein
MLKKNRGITDLGLLAEKPNVPESAQLPYETMPTPGSLGRGAAWRWLGK